MDGRLSIRTDALGRIWFRLVGRLDEPTGTAFERMVGRALPRGAAVDVLVDLRGLEDYDILGRDAFGRAHCAIAKTSRRSVYIADKPGIRGLVCLVADEHDDVHTLAVPSEEAAGAWLNAKCSAIEFCRRGGLA